MFTGKILISRPWNYPCVADNRPPWGCQDWPAPAPWSFVESRSPWKNPWTSPWEAWILMVFDGFCTFLMVFDGFWWFLMVFDGSWWFLMVFDGFCTPKKVCWKHLKTSGRLSCCCLLAQISARFMALRCTLLRSWRLVSAEGSTSRRWGTSRT